MPTAKTVSLLLKLISCTSIILLLTGFTSVDTSTPTAPGATASAAASTTVEPVASVQPVTETSYRWRLPVEQRNVLLAQAGVGQPAGVDTVTPKTKSKIHSWETGENRSYLIPALEVPTFVALLNVWNRTLFDDDRNDDGERTYAVTGDTIWEHLSKQNWEFDKDPFNVNQFAHPYQGATMYGFARSAGLGFWESWAYANAGSFLYEMAGETDHPSINDIITTGNAGSLLGEALFRMSQLVLKETHGQPDAWHELAAAVVSPPTALNRLMFGQRFKPVYPSRDPATFWRFRTGVTFIGETAAALDFGMSYGLPGRVGYSYRKPLDYFDFQVTGLFSSKNPVGSVLLRGLLYGKQYEHGENYRGIWGLYGSYDYISPSNFRISTTAVSAGTTGQYWLGPEFALQGTVLAGVGFGAAGETPVHNGDRDYHYGVTPQGMLSLRAIYNNRVALETVTRGYYVSGQGSDNSEGNESIVRFNTNLIWRIFHRHGIGLQFVEAIREAKYGNLPGKHQTNSTIGIFYTFLGDTHLGAVEWRDWGSR